MSEAIDLTAPVYDGITAAPHGGLCIEAGRIAAWLPSATRRNDPRFPAGAVILPALGDAHVHLSALGRQAREIRLGGLDYESALARLSDAHHKLPAGEWLIGTGWDQNLWRLPENGWPTAAALESACPGRPVSLKRVDGHALWANITALRQAGITAASADPEGGRILLDARGSPAGVLIDNAMNLVTRLLPRRDIAACARDLLAGQARMLAAGALRVHDMDIHDTLAQGYRDLAAAGSLALDLRVYAGARTQLAAELLRGGPQRISERLTFAGIKIYADGALGSRGAALLAPYEDAPGERGLRLWNDTELRELLAAAAAARIQIAAHAIGDAACRQLLDQFQALGDAPRRLHWRIEHAQTVAPEDLPRFAAQGIIASVQPGHAVGDCAWAPARLGPSRLRGAYAYRSLLESGAILAGGSDAPIDDESPLHGYHAATVRKNLTGEPPGGFLPEEKLTPLQALQMYTRGVAAAAGDSGGGGLKIGAPADFTVVDRDVIADPAAAAAAKILGVYRAGIQVEAPPGN